MRTTFKGIAENLLFTFNIFIVFLLVYGDKINVPYWLEPLGRLHPMLLHFPIVLLLLAMLLEFFRFKAAYTGESLYQNFTTGLLLTGVFLSAITVIMGLFLSKEDGYSGNTLEWHKWTGVAIVFIASAIYWIRNASWYKAAVAKIGAIVITIAVILAGHYGATLTHGDNFVMAPIMSKQKRTVPINQAVLFEDVILPIFSAKCLSCHNPEKAKGSLILADATSVLKGGKTGKLFVPGKPEISLLLERLHLPDDHEKHMPPKSKTQLTEAEVAILELWVKKNADLKKKVIEFPDKDSLRILATAAIGDSETTEEKFDFSAADEEVVKKLNNNYRVVYTIAKNSPALAVNIYNKSIYKPEILKELTAVKKQIVSLNLNNLPINDEALKVIETFENLRKLNLNFTSINGTGLASLKKLKYLNSLSLSGTKVSFKYVKQLLNSRSLKELALWSTAVSQTEIDHLQKLNRNVTVIGGFKDDGRHPVQLNLPRFSSETVIFKEPMHLQIKHPIKDVEIRYTLNGTEPDSLKSLIYNKEVLIDKTTSIKAKAYKKGWLSSNVNAFDFYRSAYHPDDVKYLIAPDPTYKLVDPKTLFDSQFGDFDVNSGKWCGFKEDHMEVSLTFKKPVMLQSVMINAMRQAKAYIFPPQQIEVWEEQRNGNLQLLGTGNAVIPKIDDPNAFVKIEVKFKLKKISRLKIVAKNLEKIPESYPAKGQWPWMFIDEVFLN